MEKTQYEIHLTASVEEKPTYRSLCDGMSALGIDERRSFYNIHNFSNLDQMEHDLDIPVLMFNWRTSNYENAIQKLHDTMDLFAELCTNTYNFELERFLDGNPLEVPIEQIRGDLSDYSIIEPPRAPAFETHFTWRGIRSLEAIPEYERIRELLLENGMEVDQVVDFSGPHLGHPSWIRRIATVYHQTEGEALDFSRRTQGLEEELGCRKIITEQVLVVGEPKEMAKLAEIREAS